MKYLISFFVLLLFAEPIFAQGEIDEQKKIFYRNEKTYAISLNSNGISAKFRYAQRINAFSHRVYDLEIGNLKNSKEQKTSNPYLYNSGRYVYGKLNSFYVLRVNYGYQKEVYQKRDIGGISVRKIYSIGASLGVLKPIYYQILIPPTGVIDEKFDPQKHRVGDIAGTASFFKGLNEVLPDPGINVQYMYSFEFGKNDATLRSFDVGTTAEFFLYPPKIMALTTNSPLFLTLFITYRFGKVVDSRKAKLKNIGSPINIPKNL